MRRRVINIGAKRNDSKWIDCRMASIIMLLDMFHMNRATYSFSLVYIFGVIEQIWILSQQFLVAFEVNCINLNLESKIMITNEEREAHFWEGQSRYLVKSYNGDEQTNICFRQCVPTEETLLGKYFLTSVQSFIQLFHSL